MDRKRQHCRAFTSFPLIKGKAWLGIKDPPAGEGQVGQKTPLLAKEERGGSKKTDGVDRKKIPPWLRRDGVDSLITQTDT